MNEFKKCSKGHVYESILEECPYCSGKELDEDLENLPEKPEVDPPESAMCYDIGARDYEEEKFPKIPIPPTCYMPRPPKYDD